MDKSKMIFGNEISDRAYKKAIKSKKKFIKKFGDDSNKTYNLTLEDNPTLKPFIGVKNIVTQDENEKLDLDKGIIIGNIRMGFGHYRISMAIASAAYSMGYTPLWFDLNSFKETTGGKVIDHLNSLYSLGSRLSQRFSLFNKLYWEPLNSEGFKKLSYNANDQKVSELMTPIYTKLPKEMPFIATHAWPAQAAVHAGFKRVVNVIPDNWPMALHLAEGSIHTVQTPSSYLGYKTLKGMDKEKILNPIPDDKLYNVGHYIDHELVKNIEKDSNKRLERIKNEKIKRILLTVGGAGAQRKIFTEIIKNLLPRIKKDKATLFINVGDHKNVWEGLIEDIPELNELSNKYFNDWDETINFSKKALDSDVSGIHVFYHKDIFQAVYATNLLMRSSDLVITKPSELSFYPVPKLLIKRIGGHEKWGAIRSSEIGDGTIECESVDKTIQMLNLMLDSKDILTSFNENIINANKIGIYNGAYKVVELSLNKDI
ncbi:MAG: hypothetical protein FH751_07450 [Firmicutes bacterium]|nr:hypothetical protein [Bacillota bacterium]